MSTDFSFFPLLTTRKTRAPLPGSRYAADPHSCLYHSRKQEKPGEREGLEAKGKPQLPKQPSQLCNRLSPHFHSLRRRRDF